MADSLGQLCKSGAKKNLIIALEVARNTELFRCESCSWGRHCDDSNPAPISKWVIRGSFGKIESRTCFLPMISQESHFLLRLFSHYTKAVLPYAGGLLDQPSFYGQAMEILSSRSAEIDADVMERMRNDS